MISALILPLFLAGTQANIGGAPSGDPPIRLWINNDGRFLPGDHAEVQVWTKDDGYLLVLHADPNGQLRVLFPLDPDDDNFVRGGEWYDVKGSGGREAFDIDSTSGRGMVYAAVSRDRFRFDGYRLGDRWDYQALAPSQLPREPESELTDLVRRMAQSDFDYDVLTYDVIERVVYASDYLSALSNFGRVRPFSRSRFGISAHFFSGRRFRRFHTPFRFAFDPFFHRGFFVDPFLHRGFFFDPRGLARVPFRDRRSDFRRAVNTAETGRDHWPVDVSPRRREPVTQARRDNWPVDVSSGRPEPVTEARRDHWPVDVSPRGREPVTPARRMSVRRRDPDAPTGRPAEADRLHEARRASSIEDRRGPEMAPPGRRGRESSSPPPHRESDPRSWSPPSDRGGSRGFAPSPPLSDGGGRGVSRRR